MVFAHGFGCDQSMWRFVAPAFEATTASCSSTTSARAARTSRAYDPERYASLAATPTTCWRSADELDLRDVVFVGHSVSAMIGVLAAAARARAASARWCWSARRRATSTTSGYVGGFSREDIDGLLDSLDSNYLGWSSAMAPVIMGNPDRPELGEELTNSFCRTDPDDRRAVRPRHLPVRQPRRPRRASRVPTLVLQCTRGRDRARSRSASTCTERSPAADLRACSTRPGTART